MDKYDIRVFEEDYDNFVSFTDVTYIISSTGIWIHDVTIDDKPITIFYPSGEYKKIVFMGAKDGKEGTS